MSFHVRSPVAAAAFRLRFPDRQALRVSLSTLPTIERAQTTVAGEKTKRNRSLVLLSASDFFRRRSAHVSDRYLRRTSPATRRSNRTRSHPLGLRSRIEVAPSVAPLDCPAARRAAALIVADTPLYVRRLRASEPRQDASARFPPPSYFSTTSLPFTESRN